jgi:methionyl-tRNA formyltransferase
MPLRFIFFGTSSDYSLIPLQRLAAEHQLMAIVESGEQGCRSGKLTLAAKISEMIYALMGQPSLWAVARRRGLPYFHLCRGHEAELANFLKPLNADIGCVASFNQLLPPSIFKIPRLGVINFHPALLPKFRGPNVWFWEYYEMEREGGATVHYIDENEDTGDILKQASFPIPTQMPPRDLQIKSIELGEQLLSAAMEAIELGLTKPVPQRHLACPQRGRYLKPGEDLFPWQNWPIERVTHFLAGVYPWHRAFNSRHGWLGQLPWRATGFARERISIPGKLKIDRRGVYFAHPQGKVRLAPAFPRERITLWLGLAIALALALLVKLGSTP